MGATRMNALHIPSTQTNPSEPIAPSDGRIYVLHGRRGKIPASNIRLIERTIERSGRPSVIAFLEGDEQTLEDGIRQLQRQVSHIIVIPVLLFAATHVRRDTPRRIGEVIDQDVALTYLPPLGTTEAIFTYLSNRLSQATVAYPGRKVLIVAHGTGHYPEPYEQLQALAKRLESVIGTPVLTANLIAEPRIAHVLADEKSPCIVQRLFLTDGRLSHRIEETIDAVQPGSVFLPTLEDQPVISEAIGERLAQVGIRPEDAA